MKFDTIVNNLLEESLILELKQHGSSDESTFDFVYYKGNIWIFNDDEELDEPHLKEISEIFDEEFDQYYDVVAYFNNTNLDGITGQYVESGNTLYINQNNTFTRDPKSSIQLKKLAEHFGVDSISYNSGEDDDTEEFNIEGEIPDMVYHGTSSELLPRILKIGLRPNEASSNYEEHGIIHDDLVFFTSKESEAVYHAYHTADKKNGHPVVIRFTIPDKDKLVADYDVDKQTSDTTYKHIKGRKDYESEMDSFKASKEFGIYGYKGNIMPSNIKEVYIDWYSNDNQSSPHISKFEEYDPKEVLDAYNKHGELEEYSFYDDEFYGDEDEY